MDFHLEMEAAKYEAQGTPPAASARLAKREFGNTTRVREEVRDAHGLAWWDDLWQDIRFAVRSIRRSPGFHALLIGTLVLGIGLTTVIVSVVDAIMLRPGPYVDVAHTVNLGERRADGSVDVDLRPTAYDLWQGQPSVFDATAWYDIRGAEYRGPTAPESLIASQVSPDFFPILRAPAFRGRTFQPGDIDSGAGSLAVVSYSFWRVRLQGDLNAIGRTLVFDGMPHTLIGVMPADFGYPERRTEVWFLTARKAPHDGALSFIGHIRTDLVTAQLAVDNVGRILAPEHEWLKDFRWALAPFPVRRLNPDVVLGLKVLAAAAFCVLLIACVNGANLLLFRGVTRRREFAVRLALGSGRWRLVRLVLVESLGLAAVAGSLAILLSFVGVATVAHSIPIDFTWTSFHDIEVSRRVLAFTGILSLATGALFGCLPALRAGRADAQVFRLGRLAGGARHRGSLRHALVGGEIAFSAALLLAAGLFVHSFLRLTSVRPGIDVARLLALHVGMSSSRFPDSASRRSFLGRLEEALTRTPGVVGITLAAGLPPMSGGLRFAEHIEVEGDTPPAGQPGIIPNTAVDVDYFRTVGTPILLGRSFTQADVRDPARPVIVDPDFARWLWPERSPIGRRFRFSSTEGWLTVVGVAADAKLFGPDDRQGRFELYYPADPHEFQGEIAIGIRSAGDPRLLLEPIQSLMRRFDPVMPVWSISTLEDEFGAAVSKPRFLTDLVLGFATTALSLMLIGLYGVLSYSVSERTGEIGLRLALGANPHGIIALFMRQGSVVIAVGVAVGLLLALAASRLIGSLLFGVTPYDPAIFTIVPCLIFGVSLLASFVAVRRASNVDPMTVLRVE